MLPLTAEQSLEFTSLPLLHGGPFDRLLIAQAIVEELVVLTDDDRSPSLWDRHSSLLRLTGRLIP